MSLQARTVLNLIAGAVGGFLAWLLVDPTGWFSSLFDNGLVMSEYSAEWWLQVFFGGIVGGVIGFLLGLVNALGDDSAQMRLRGALVHTAIGFAGGSVGIGLGQIVYGIIAPRSAGTGIITPGDFVLVLVARALGWSVIGAGIGLAQGAARRSAKVVRQGVFGGCVGGLIGGVLFQCAATTIQSPHIARLLGIVSIGSCTGLFIGLVQAFFRRAWIRVVLGRNEGKEYLIDKPVVVIGRSELADIGLFGNPSIMPHQCALEQVGGRYRLRAIFEEPPARRGVGQADVKVNGAVVNPDVWLTDGDTIVIGDRTLRFLEKLARQSDIPVSSAVLAPVGAKPTARVTVIEGRGIGSAFWLTDGTSSIGRMDDCAVMLPDDTLISRRHASIQAEGAGWILVDNGSANGSFVNDEKLPTLSSRPLKSGDRITVGDTVLRFDS
jgi:pSer/pThr/pTyr-binding forkhead associated (FHA) protein